MVPSKKLIIGQRLMRRVQSDNERISEKGENVILAHFQDFLTILNCNMLPSIIFCLQLPVAMHTPNTYNV